MREHEIDFNTWRIPADLAPQDFLVLKTAWEGLAQPPGGYTRQQVTFKTKVDEAIIERLSSERQLLATQQIGQRRVLRPTVLGLFHLPGTQDLLRRIDQLIRLAGNRYSPEPQPQTIPTSELLDLLQANDDVRREDLEKIVPYFEDLGLAFSMDGGLSPSELTWKAGSLEGVLAKRYRQLLHESRPAHLDRWKPLPFDLQVTGLHVRNFRALRDFDLGVGPLVALVGPNAIGKSTVLDVLGFVARACIVGVASAVREFGGFDRLATRGSGGPIEVEVRFRIRHSEHTEEPGRYRFRLATSQGTLFVEDELLEIEEGGRRREIVSGNRGRFSLENAEGKQEILYGAADSLGLVQYGEEHRFALAARLRRALSRVVLVDGDPLLITGGDMELLGHHESPGRRSRAAVSMDDLFDPILGQPKLLERLGRILHELVPAVRSISRVHDERTGRPELLVEEADLPGGLALSELSAGTRQMLIIAALHVHAAPRAAILLEEPDGRVHPSAMASLAALLRSLAQRSTVLVTTHSPTFVSFMDATYEVFGLTRDSGNVRALPLRELVKQQGWLTEFGTTREAFERASMERR